MAISQYENEYYGLSGDVKPLGTPLNGRKFTEMDTSKEYRFDAENQQWLQQSGPGGGSTTLSGLTDVDISNPTDGQTLVYNATTGKWENGAGGGAILDSTTDAEDRLIVAITAGELYALVQKSMVTIKSAMTEGSVQIVNYFLVMFATTDGNTYSFSLGGSLSAAGLLSTDTVVFTRPK